MKKAIFVILLIVGTASFVNAQNQSVEQVKVTALVEKLRTAMISGNKDDLESMLSKDLSYGHSNGKIQTRADFVEAISSKKSDFVKIDLIQPSVVVIEKTAIARHILIADTNDGGKPAHIYLGIVLVWRQENGDWKLIARRAFHVPAPSEGS
jgi:ketosteroid isomerase-like protein